MEKKKYEKSPFSDLIDFILKVFNFDNKINHWIYLQKSIDSGYTSKCFTHLMKQNKSKWVGIKLF